MKTQQQWEVWSIPNNSAAPPTGSSRPMARQISPGVCKNQEMPEKDRIAGTSQTDMGRDRAPARCWHQLVIALLFLAAFSRSASRAGRSASRAEAALVCDTTPLDA